MSMPAFVVLTAVYFNNPAIVFFKTANSASLKPTEL